MKDRGHPRKVMRNVRIEWTQLSQWQYQLPGQQGRGAGAAGEAAGVCLHGVMRNRYFLYCGLSGRTWHSKETELPVFLRECGLGLNGFGPFQRAVMLVINGNAYSTQVTKIVVSCHFRGCYAEPVFIMSLSREALHSNCGRCCKLPFTPLPLHQ